MGGSLREQKLNALAEELVHEGLLTAEHLAFVKESQNNLGGDLGEILVRHQFISEEELSKLIAKKAGLTAISLKTYQPDPNVLKLLTPTQVHRWQIFPLFEVEEKLTCATADPFDLGRLDEIRTELGREVDWVVATKKDIQDSVGKHYSKAIHFEISDQVEVVHPEGGTAAHSISPSDQLERDAQSGQVVETVSQILSIAFRERASDVHIEPVRDGLKVRLRIDGVLETLKKFPASLKQPILSRIKILGGMDVAEHRMPQDGRVRLKISGHELDFRIATYPTMNGEAAAIRLLSKDKLITLNDLGFLGHDQEILEELIQKPHGIFLVTGPTGSGKTTTLYAALQKIDRQKHHVLSVEDPIESEIEGVDQTQISLKAGVTFPSVLRSMLRQDPDVIFVGEIRDQETADISLRAALTGHLVFSSLHTNTALGAIARLTDLGVEAYLISSTLLGVLAQRLVRRICQACKQDASVPPEVIKKWGDKAQGLTAFQGKGCKECGMRGYKGRVGLFELVKLDEEMRVLINNKAPEVRLKEKAATNNFHTALEDGIEKIRLGVTTVEEVMRILE